MFNTPGHVNLGKKLTNCILTNVKSKILSIPTIKYMLTLHFRVLLYTHRCLTHPSRPATLSWLRNFTNTPRCNNFGPDCTNDSIPMASCWPQSGGGNCNLNRLTVMGNATLWEPQDISQKKRGRKMRVWTPACVRASVRKKEEACCKKVKQRAALEPFLLMGNDGGAVWWLRAFDPVTACSRENQVPGHVSLSPSYQHTHTHTATYTHTLPIKYKKNMQKRRLSV